MVSVHILPFVVYLNLARIISANASIHHIILGQSLLLKYSTNLRFVSLSLAFLLDPMYASKTIPLIYCWQIFLLLLVEPIKWHLYHP